jgi:hypothetical protein
VDEAEAGRRFVAIAVGCRGNRRTVERGAESVDGVALEAEPDVGVDGGGDANVGVAEKFLETTSSTPSSRRRVAVECRRSWKRFCRSRECGVAC